MRVISGPIFTGDRQRPSAEAVVTEDGVLAYVGELDRALAIAGPDVEVTDTAGGLVMPGFIDAHAHLQGTGSAVGKVLLRDAEDLAAIQSMVAGWAAAHPDSPRVMGLGWQYGAVPGGRPTAAMLDIVVPDRPVYLDAFDFHSTWLNSAALAEVGITDDTPDPIGGEIVRDDEGRATGYLLENAAVELAWAKMNDVDEATRDRWTSDAVRVYTASGVTTVVDMGLDARSLGAILRAEAAGDLQLRIVGHWLIDRTGDPASELAQVGEAVRLAAIHRSDRVRIAGIKIVVDGTIDACTAAMLHPYASGAVGEPIWDDESLRRVVTAADAAGLQVAMHAIGDAAARSALDALEHARRENGTTGRRHRIEHLEYVDAADVPRLGAMGVTASMQPVHADPATFANWAAMLGDERAERGFAWPEFVETGAVLAFGTDSPTANHEPLPNMYLAATRCSPTHHHLPAHRPDFARPLPEAFAHGTSDAAFASFMDDRIGMLRTGFAADLVILDGNPLAAGPNSLLGTRVVETIVAGVTVHRLT